MSTLLEPRTSVLMGRERYKDNSLAIVESTAFVASNYSLYLILYRAIAV